MNHIVVIPLSTKYEIQKRFLGATNSQEIIILFIFEGYLADYLPDQHWPSVPRWKIPFVL